MCLCVCLRIVVVHLLFIRTHVAEHAAWSETKSSFDKLNVQEKHTLSVINKAMLLSLNIFFRISEVQSYDTAVSGCFSQY